MTQLPPQTQKKDQLQISYYLKAPGQTRKSCILDQGVFGVRGGVCNAGFPGAKIPGAYLTALAQGQMGISVTILTNKEVM